MRRHYRSGRRRRRAKPVLQCRLWNTLGVACEGPLHRSGLCDRHAGFFRWWIQEGEGLEVYTTRGTSPIAEENPPRLRDWKRAKFREWLEGLADEQAAAIEAWRQVEPEESAV